MCKIMRAVVKLSFFLGSYYCNNHSLFASYSLEEVESKVLERLELCDKEKGKLDLSNLELTSDHFSSSVEKIKEFLIENSEIYCLDLSNNKLGDEGVVLLADILGGSGITELSFRKNYITTNGISNFIEKLKYSDLTSLDVSQNLIYDSGVRKIVSGYEGVLRKLEKLSLEETGLKEVEALCGCSSYDEPMDQ